jgi:hypothetical protein
MKKMFLILLAAAVMIYTAACTKKGNNNPSAPVFPTLSATTGDSPTISPTFTISETHTVSPTITVSPTSSFTPTLTATATVTATYTVTCTITPFVMDDFEDNDLYNNVTPGPNPPNLWYEYTLTGLVTPVPTPFLGTGTGVGIGHGLDMQGIAFSDLTDGAGNYYGYFGTSAPVFTGTGTGINVSMYQYITFWINIGVINAPSAGTVRYMFKLMDNSGNTVEQEIVSPPSEAWGFFQMSVSGFTLPAGASGYTVADVLSNVVDMKWEYDIVSSSSTDYSECWIWLDDITLELP